MYGICRNSAIRNPAAPITGGVICPPVEATASKAPATLGEKPAWRMSGMVMTPVDATLDTALPEIEPNMADATTAILAEPPRVRPMRVAASWVNHSEPPARISNWPMKMYITTTMQQMYIDSPNRATLSIPR